MLTILTSILFLVGLAADWNHLRNRVAQKSGNNSAFIFWIALTDLLPVAGVLVRLISRDNGPVVMTVFTWCIWGWIALVLPRLLYYVLCRIGWPRTACVVAAGLVLFILWGTTWGRTRIEVNRIEIISSKIPETFDGFRFVQISDMHVGDLLAPESEIGHIVDSINALQPNAVFFTGDLVSIRAGELTPSIMRSLQRIQAPVWSVTGNHDIGTYIKDTIRHPALDETREVIRRQEAMGWCVLQDTTCYLRQGDDSIALTGLSFDRALRKRRHDRDLPATSLAKSVAGVPKSLYNIVLVHIPQLWEQITQAGYGDLTLAGHVHSMQFKIRPWGRGWSPAQWFYTHWSGRYDADGRTLYVNDGTGYVGYPMRLGAWPEVTLFTLKRCE